MTDDTSQPRAQYGEYASPEQQALAKGESAPAPNHHVSPVAHPQAPVSVPTGGKRRHPVDRIVTISLLGLGLFIVVTSIPGYLRMAETLQSAFDQMGTGTYTATDLADTLGITAILVMALIWIAAAVSSAASLKRDRISWWIPVVAGAVAFVALMIIVTVALFADPAFISSLEAMTPNV